MDCGLKSAREEMSIAMNVLRQRLSGAAALQARHSSPELRALLAPALDMCDSRCRAASKVGATQASSNGRPRRPGRRGGLEIAVGRAGKWRTEEDRARLHNSALFGGTGLAG